MSQEYSFEYTTLIRKHLVSSKLQFDASTIKEENGIRTSFSSAIDVDDNSAISDFMARANKKHRIGISFFNNYTKKLYQKSFSDSCLISGHITTKQIIRYFDNGKRNISCENIFRMMATNGSLSSMKDLPLIGDKTQDYIVLAEALDEVICNVMNPKEIVPLPNNISKRDFVFSSQASAFLIHEIFGHLLELDYFENINSLFNPTMVGKRLFNTRINVVDDPFLLSDKGIDFGKFDDVGAPIQRKKIVENGVLVDVISSQRVDTLRNSPLYRMFNLYMCADTTGPSQDEMIVSVKDGIFVGNASAGNVNPFDGTFCLYLKDCREIKSGEIQTGVYSYTMVSSIRKILDSIEVVGNDLKIFPSQCKKGGQIITVGTGSASIMISEKNIIRE